MTNSIARNLSREARDAERANRRTHADGRARRDARRDKRRAQLAASAADRAFIADHFVIVTVEL